MAIHLEILQNLDWFAERWALFFTDNDRYPYGSEYEGLIDTGRAAEFPVSEPPGGGPAPAVPSRRTD